MSDLGFTPIYERARAQFGISRDEYALCNYVQTWSSHPENSEPGWCDRTQMQIAEWTGITDRGVRKMIGRLADFGLIERSENGRNLRVTKRWFQVVNQAKAEQSSGKNPEQSSSKKRNKVPENPEQSSSKKRNKVPTHNNYNSKYSNSNSKLSADAPKKQTKTSKPKKQKAPPNSAAPPRKKEPTLTWQMREVFEQHYKRLFNDEIFDWQAKEWAAVKQIGNKLRERLEKKQMPKEDADVLNSWNQFLQMASDCDEWTVENGFTPSRLNGNYQSLIQKIIAKNGKANKPKLNARGKEVIDPATRLERAIATGRKIADEIAAGKL